MSKAIELAKECGAWSSVQIGDAAIVFTPDQLDVFFRRAQAMALREAADKTLKIMSCSCAKLLRNSADELEAGK